MHLRSITMKGFKSFPDRTRLEFARGVSVIVGPNGSGKSNVTDAVLWALGEQSPLAVRGQSMQDVIFSGSPGIASRSAAEVEVVIDDADGELETGFSELSILRRLDRSGEGEYRMNGARCRLVDVLEALSDTGLGREMHSVVSQGRVEGVVHSSPRERRLLIEEAAGLGKHRKRRRRAELKLRRTGDNLSRALDIEREARSRLRPLKRQAEAAEHQARLERQSLDARLELSRDDAAAADAALGTEESAAREARDRRDGTERRLAAVRSRREEAERGFAERARTREALARRSFAATTATDRVEMRLERVRELSSRAAANVRRLREEVARLELESPAGASPAGAAAQRVAALEAGLAALDSDSRARLEAGGPDPEHERLHDRLRGAERRRADAERTSSECDGALRDADAAAAAARQARRDSSAALERVRDEAARTAAEAEAVASLARSAAPAPGSDGALARHLQVERGYELALAAALGPRLRAGLAADVSAGAALLDEVSAGAALLLDAPGTGAQPTAPLPGAERLLDRVSASPLARAAVERLLADAWVLESFDELPAGFRGTAVTRSGRALLAGVGELRQVLAGADDALLERLSSREQLSAAATAAGERAQRAETQAAAAAGAVTAAEEARDAAAAAVRAAQRERDEAEVAQRAAERALVEHEAAVDESLAVRRAELGAELRAERRMLERAQHELAAQRGRDDSLRRRLAGEQALAVAAESAAPALAAALAALSAQRESIGGELAADEASGARAGEELRDCAREEAELQAELRDAGEVVTEAEVRAQRARDAATEARQEVTALSQRLGAALAEPAPRALSEQERADLGQRIARLAQRREQLGPVNPLARSEYEQALEHVEELEAQRHDLETALAELEGIIAETDRRIRERFESTFEATARNFEEVAEELFPGGRGKLRLAAPRAPRPVLGDEDPPVTPPPSESADSEVPDDSEPGVEVEVTPAGKSTRRLSLMSGGERSLVALAFLFAVFLARPCPFYVLDEVEAALDDPNIDRFLRLVRRCAERAQFIVVTHQKRTMDAADRLYGVSMGGDGVSKIVSRRLPARVEEGEEGAADADVAA